MTKSFSIIKLTVLFVNLLNSIDKFSSRIVRISFFRRQFLSIFHCDFFYLEEILPEVVVLAPVLCDFLLSVGFI